VLTTAGPIARSVADLRLALEVIGGPDSHDPEVRRCLGGRPGQRN
jgi:Asp-tRNA(Asn)/Glu-tRNA(Gln) amidotransferase A subunit family amidase